jgi:hypothetical protein
MQLDAAVPRMLLVHSSWWDPSPLRPLCMQPTSRMQCSCVERGSGLVFAAVRQVWTRYSAAVCVDSNIALCVCAGGMIGRARCLCSLLSC